MADRKTFGHLSYRVATRRQSFSFSRAKRTFDRELDIEPYTLHDLRRTFSSIMAKLGTPIHVTEKILNYASSTISGVAAVYNRHSYQDEMREAFAAYESYLQDLQSS